MHNVDLDTRFDLHPATEETGPKMDRMRATLKEAARQVRENTPASREQSVALTKLEETLFWANAAIARNGLARGGVVTGGLPTLRGESGHEQLAPTTNPPPDASSDFATPV